MPKSQPHVAVIGATGAVGDVFLRVAEQRNFPMRSLKLLATARSAGKKLRFRGEISRSRRPPRRPSRAPTSCSARPPRRPRGEYAPFITADGAVMIDDGSAFRMQPNVPLVIPEVNGDDVEWHEGIISIPNCTTTPLAMALHAMRQVAPLRRVTVATYQATSGTGAAAVEELRTQLAAFGRGEPIPAPSSTRTRSR